MAGTALEMRKQFKEFTDFLNSQHPKPEIGAVGMSSQHMNRNIYFEDYSLILTEL